MKQFTIIGLFSLLTLSIIAQDQQEKAIESFSGISASGAVNIKYRNSDTNKVVLMGEKEDFDKIQFYNRENTLFFTSSGTISIPLWKIKSISPLELSEVQ